MVMHLCNVFWVGLFYELFLSKLCHKNITKYIHDIHHMMAAFSYITTKVMGYDNVLFIVFVLRW